MKENKHALLLAGVIILFFVFLLRDEYQAFTKFWIQNAHIVRDDLNVDRYMLSFFTTNMMILFIAEILKLSLMKSMIVAVGVSLIPHMISYVITDKLLMATTISIHAISFFCLTIICTSKIFVFKIFSACVVGACWSWVHFNDVIGVDTVCILVSLMWTLYLLRKTKSITDEWRFNKKKLRHRYPFLIFAVLVSTILIYPSQIL